MGSIFQAELKVSGRRPAPVGKVQILLYEAAGKHGLDELTSINRHTAASVYSKACAASSYTAWCNVIALKRVFLKLVSVVS